MADIISDLPPAPHGVSPAASPSDSAEESIKLFAFWQSYEFTIKNNLSVELKRTESRDLDGSWKNKGDAAIAPGAATKLKCRANMIGLNCFVTYTAVLAGKSVSASFHVHSDLATAPRMELAKSSDTTLLKVTKVRGTSQWNIDHTCPDGYHWDSDVDACVRNQHPALHATALSNASLSASAKDEWKEFATSTTGQLVKSVVAFGLGQIPYAGKVLSTLVGVLWPKSTTDPKELWDSLEKYAEALFDKKIAQHEMDQIKIMLEQVSARMDELAFADPSRKPQIFLSCFDHLEILKKRAVEHFTEYLSVGIPTLTLYLAALAVYLDVDNQLWEKPLNDEEKQSVYEKANVVLRYKTALKEHIAELKKQRGNTLFDQRQVDIEMDVYWDVARVWPHMLHKFPKGTITESLTVEERLNYFYPLGVKTPEKSFTDVASTHISEIVVRSGDWLDGIRVTHNGSVTSGFHGQKSGGPSVFYLDSDEYVVRIEGRASDRVYQLVFVTNKGKTFAPHFGHPERGEPFPVKIKEQLGRDVLLAVHGAVPTNSAHVQQLYFEFGPKPN